MDILFILDRTKQEGSLEITLTLPLQNKLNIFKMRREIMTRTTFNKKYKKVKKSRS